MDNTEWDLPSKIPWRGQEINLSPEDWEIYINLKDVFKVEFLNRKLKDFTADKSKLADLVKVEE